MEKMDVGTEKKEEERALFMDRLIRQMLCEVTACAVQSMTWLTCLRRHEQWNAYKAETTNGEICEREPTIHRTQSRMSRSGTHLDCMDDVDDIPEEESEVPAGQGSFTSPQAPVPSIPRRYRRHYSSICHAGLSTVTIQLTNMYSPRLPILEGFLLCSHEFMQWISPYG